MPSADFCPVVNAPYGAFSLLRAHGPHWARDRPPEVSSTAFNARPPDLHPVPLMDMGFATTGPLARHDMPEIRFLFIGPRLCLALLSDARLATTPLGSAILHLHQVGPGLSPGAVEHAR